MARSPRGSSKRRRRGGDILAALLLLAMLAGIGWFWWAQRHQNQLSSPASPPPPASQRPAPPVSAPAPPVSAPAPAQTNEVIPVPPTVERIPPPPVPPVPPRSPATNESAPAILTNLPPGVPPAAPQGFPRSAKNVFEAQVALARQAISPGIIDWAMGSQTRAAVATFQQANDLPPTLQLDTNTLAQLQLESPPLIHYVVSSNDLARLQPLGRTWLAKSQQSALEYESLLQLVAEKGHALPLLVKKLNPGVDWAAVPAGAILTMPDVAYPDPSGKAGWVTIHLAEKYLEAFDTESNLLAHFPCSIAAKVEKRPVGELHVKVLVPHPNYTFDPAVFPESAEAQAVGHKLVLPPGPKNPVGVAWIGLDKPGYGLHGTPNPEQIGHTESHGCFRLANWDAEYLLKLAWIGMPVYVEP